VKTKRRLGVYAGSFDPLTVGHLWMIEQGVALFDQLVVGIGVNPNK
jgi:pantetheine-phosphate adenylyltransferase